MPKKKRKRYFAKVYDKGGTFITVLSKISDPVFSMQINGGLGQLQFSIPRKFDDFDENYVIASRNILQVWCVDGDTGSDGKLIYTGYIPDYNPTISGSEENVTVLLYGFVTELMQVPLKIGDYLTLKTDTIDTFVFKTTEPDQIEPTDVMRKIIDIYQDEKTAYQVTYDAESIPADTGNVIAYSFVAQMCMEAINKVMEFVPGGWYYFVGPDNKFQFKEAPQTATHTFVLERDFAEVNVDKTIQNLANKIMFTNNKEESLIVKFYEDAASVAQFGEYWAKIEDSGVTDIAVADLQAQTFLESRAWPTVRTKVRILDNNNRRKRGQDIESIYPGDTCKFRGFNDVTSQTFNENMLIVKVDYTPDYVDLELEELQPNIARDILALIKRVSPGTSSPTDLLLVASDTIQSNIHKVGAAGEPAFLNGWTNYSPGETSVEWEHVRFLKSADNEVTIQGLAKNGTLNQPMFVLPPGFRPKANIMWVGLSSNGSADVVTRVDVAPNGNVSPRSVGGNSFVNFTGFKFKIID